MTANFKTPLYSVTNYTTVHKNWWDSNLYLYREYDIKNMFADSVFYSYFKSTVGDPSGTWTQDSLINGGKCENCPHSYFNKHKYFY